jgi:hypothetical protein
MKITHRMLMAVVGATLAAAVQVTPLLAASPSAPPVAPAGWHASGLDLSKVPGATVQTLTLDPQQCAAVKQTAPSTDQSCQFREYSLHVNHRSVPAGKQFNWDSSALMVSSSASAASLLVSPATSSSDPYWYWHDWDQICTIAGCGVMSLSLEEDGVANGWYVWQWNVTCTPGGWGTSILPGGCFYLHNGGGAPYYGIQFGLNGQACVAWNGIGCFNHGMRRWISRWGDEGSFAYQSW